MLPKTVTANFTPFKTCTVKNNILLTGFLCTQHWDALFMFSTDYILCISKNESLLKGS
jgi:hypothetical protein